MRGISNLIFGGIVVVALAIFVSLGIFGCNSHNVETPAGYVGYITRGSWFGSTVFYNTQKGPTSTGLGWMLFGQNVSVTPYTYDEEFPLSAENSNNSVLSKDHMQIGFAVHITFRINPDRVQDFVEHYSTLQETNNKSDDLVKDAYNNFLKQRVRTIARQQVENYKWQELDSSAMKAISTDTESKILAVTKDTCFDVQAASVGNLQFPPSVTQAVAEAQAATQVLQRKEMEIKQAEADARKKVAEAQGIADSMKLINKELTPEYVQYQAIQAQTSQVNSQNHTVIYIPVGPMGVPIVANVSPPTTQASK